MVTSYVVDNDFRFRNAIERARLVTDDLRIPLGLITKDFYRGQKAIFQLGGPGQYPDLSEKYKDAKKAATGFVYPILKRTGALARSMTDPNDGNAIAEIINRAGLILGTKVSYGIFHQLGTKKMPMRKFLFIGPEAISQSVRETQGRPERWLSIINEFVMEKMRVLGEPNVAPRVG